ncbi:hypothetical protein [Clostridium botulinum]|nr:hypothetical protein [Clostridium botulinum]MCC5423432.1 hypothetical protein [Clostridium botulinum]
MVVIIGDGWTGCAAPISAEKVGADVSIFQLISRIVDVKKEEGKMIALL